MGVSSCSQQLETDLKIEREWRQTLQNDLERERGTVSQLSTEALQIKMLKQVIPQSTIGGRGGVHLRVHLCVHLTWNVGWIGCEFKQTRLDALFTTAGVPSSAG